MSEPFIAEIRMFAGNFAPRGWAFCNGQILAITQNTALFSLLGTTYGGNGQSTFGLPNLQGRAPMHVGWGQGPGLSSHVLGETSGDTAITLLSTEMPTHTHSVMAGALPANLAAPSSTRSLSRSAPGAAYVNGPPSGQIASPMAIGVTGGNLPHNNMMPSLAVSFIIALQGIYPARN